MELYTLRSSTFIDKYILENYPQNVIISDLGHVVNIADLLPDKFFAHSIVYVCFLVSLFSFTLAR